MKSFMMCIMDMSHAHARDSGVSNPWGQQGLSHPSRNVVSVCGWPQLLCLSAIRLISCRSKQSFPKMSRLRQQDPPDRHPWGTLGYRAQNIIPNAIADPYGFLGLSFLPWRMEVGVGYTWEDFNHAVSFLSVFSGCTRHM